MINTLIRKKVLQGPLQPHVLFGWIDEDGNAYGVQVDRHGSLCVIDFVHHEIHEGDMWSASVHDATVADAATLIFSSPDPIGDSYHLTFTAQCEGHATVELIEDAQPTGGGNINSYNMNRPTGDAGALIWLKDPALGGGTVIAGPSLLPGGSGPHSGGGILTTRVNTEWILNPLYAYAIRLTNVSGGEKEASLQATYYS